MDEPEVDNRTDFVVQPHVLLDKDGETLVTMVKATFVQDEIGMLQPAAEQRPLRFADEPWGDPITTPPKYPCDACGPKPGTDVVVVAKGHAPDGKPVSWFDVGVRVGPLEKVVRVFGLRVWLDGGAGLSAPKPLTEQEIRYDFAWGGLDASDLRAIVEEARNPVGTGVVRDRARLTHQRAPCLEQPAAPIGSAQPVPAGIGAIGPHWAPRRQFVGTYDDRWHREQAPLFPHDRDDRANLCASPGLTATPPLRGGEEVALMNLTPGGGLCQFLLPELSVEIREERRNAAPVLHRCHLDTVVIDTLEPAAPSRVTVELVWRALGRVPRRMKDLRLVVAAEPVRS